MLRSARALMYETMASTWARTQAGEALTMDERADILLAAVHSAQVGAEVTDMMFTSGGFQRRLRGPPAGASFPRRAGHPAAWLRRCFALRKRGSK